MSGLMTDEKMEVKRTCHGNCIQAGVPVVPLADFEAAARDLMDADRDFWAAILEVAAAQDQAVPPADQYLGFLLHAEQRTRDLFDLTNSETLPNRAYEDDYRYVLTYGKQRRNPLGHMAKRMMELRKAAARLRKRLGELT